MANNTQSRTRNPCPRLLGLCQCVQGRFKNKLMFVAECVEQIDLSSIAAAIDMDPTIAGGAWQPARIHHACRFLAPPEAVCERTGSLMHALWDPVQGLSPDQFVNRLFLRSAGIYCIGAARDEMIVREIVVTLQNVFNCRPCSVSARGRYSKRPMEVGTSTSRSVRRHCNRASRQLDLMDVDTLEAGLADYRFEYSARVSVEIAADTQKEALRPSSTPRDLAAELWRNMSTSHVPKLPLYVESAKQKRAGVGSSVRANLEAWLNSEQGIKWRSARRELWQSTF